MTRVHATRALPCCVEASRYFCKAKSYSMIVKFAKRKWWFCGAVVRMNIRISLNWACAIHRADGYTFIHRPNVRMHTGSEYTSTLRGRCDLRCWVKHTYTLLTLFLEWVALLLIDVFLTFALFSYNSKELTLHRVVDRRRLRIISPSVMTISKKKQLLQLKAP